METVFQLRIDDYQVWLEFTGTPSNEEEIRDYLKEKYIREKVKEYEAG